MHLQMHSTIFHRDKYRIKIYTSTPVQVYLIIRLSCTTTHSWTEINFQHLNVRLTVTLQNIKPEWHTRTNTMHMHKFPQTWIREAWTKFKTLYNWLWYECNSCEFVDAEIVSTVNYFKSLRDVASQSEQPYAISAILF